MNVSKFVKQIQKYTKAVVATAGAVSVAVADGVLDANDGITIGLVFLTAIGVYAFPNRDLT